jgi:ABC-type spermidine/putrescine transport system permease subunit II
MDGQDVEAISLLSLLLYAPLMLLIMFSTNKGATYLRSLTINKLSVLTARNHAQLFLVRIHIC